MYPGPRPRLHAPTPALAALPEPHPPARETRRLMSALPRRPRIRRAPASLLPTACPQHPVASRPRAQGRPHATRPCARRSQHRGPPLFGRPSRRAPFVRVLVTPPSAARAQPGGPPHPWLAQALPPALRVQPRGGALAPLLRSSCCMHLSGALYTLPPARAAPRRKRGPAGRTAPAAGNEAARAGAAAQNHTCAPRHRRPPQPMGLGTGVRGYKSG